MIMKSGLMRDFLRQELAKEHGVLTNDKKYDLLKGLVQKKGAYSVSQVEGASSQTAKAYNDFYLFPYRFDYLVQIMNRTEAITLNPEAFNDDLERNLLQRKVKDSIGVDVLYTKVNFSDLKVDHFN